MESQTLVFMFSSLLMLSQTATVFMITTTIRTPIDDDHMFTTAINNSDTYTDPRRPDTVVQDVQTASQDHGSPVIQNNQQTSTTVFTLHEITTDCPPTYEKTLTDRAGVIVFTEPEKHCSDERKWNIHLPSTEDGIVLQLNSFYIREGWYFRVKTYGIHRDLPRIDSFYPLLLTTNRIQILLETPYIRAFGTAKREYSYINFTYTAHPIKNMPWKKNPFRNIYICSGDVLIPAVFRCNMVQECVGNEDEVDCDYIKEGCGKWIPLRDVCLIVDFLFSSYFDGLSSPDEECSRRYGARLVQLKGLDDVKFIGRILRQAGASKAIIGAKKVRPVSKNLRHLYRHLWQWGDRGSPIVYGIQLEKSPDSPFSECSVMKVTSSAEILFYPTKCTKGISLLDDIIICMKPNLSYPKVRVTVPSSLHLPKPSHRINKFPTKQCSDGSVMQKFHNCYLDSSQDAMTRRFALFPCRYGQPVHYTLVCDGNGDCIDNSDETECGIVRFSPLLNSVFRCDNFQLVPKLKRCDGRFDCFDESDEERCTFCGDDNLRTCVPFGCQPKRYNEFWMICGIDNTFRGFTGTTYCNSSFIVSMDGFGITFPYSADENNTEGMFYCQEGDYYIPSFLLNNGEQDCASGEDENIPTQNLPCPGFYRCYISESCVHPDQVCDGIHHCPYKDDERYCDLVCPDKCLCEGYAFTCTKFSNFSQFLQVRYLDFSGSVNISLMGMKFLELLLVLNLSYCDLDTVYLQSMPQLQELDLRFNQLMGISSLAIVGLSGLRSLDVSGNPLEKTLDTLFETFLKMSGLSSLRSIAMRNTEVHAITNEAFNPLRQLEVLDIRNNFIDSYDKEVFEGLHNLQKLYTDDSRLCCPYFHGSRSIDCVSPFDELSSCTDLLRQNTFKVFLWLVGLLAALGNAAVMLYQLFAAKQNKLSVFRVLIINMCAADFIMGLYAMVIGITDAYFRGVYVAKENIWKGSLMCKIAGFLGFVSSEASVMTVCLVTFDRVSVLCFPLKSHFHFGTRSSLTVCGVLWFVAVTLAGVPLLAGLKFYGVSSICLPLPISRRRFSGQFYSFGVFIVFNFVVFILIGLGQIFIYRAILSAGKTAGTSRRPQEMTIARRLFLVILSDFCCWFPVGVMGLLVANGTFVSDKVNVWTAIFVLPLNSALNPFLYTLNSILEKRRADKLKRETMRVVCNIQTLLPLMPPNTAEQLLGICIQSDVMKREEILQMLQLRQQREKNEHAPEFD